MSFIRKSLSLIMALCMVFCITACKNDNKVDKAEDKTQSTPSSSSIPNGSVGGVGQNNESDYKDTVSEWKSDAENSNEAFDNTSENGAETPTPGDASELNAKAATADKAASVTVGKEQKKEAVINKNSMQGAKLYDPDFKRNYTSETTLSGLVIDKDTLQCFYEGSNYAYGITEDGREIIAFRDEYGNLLDILDGAGRFNLCNSTGSTLLQAMNVASFKEGFRNGYDTVSITYQLSGRASDSSTITSLYIFKENSIDYSITVKSNTDISYDPNNSTIRRTFKSSYIDSDCRVVNAWNYPANGDGMYPDFGGLLYETQIDKHLFMYTYRNDNGMPITYSNVQKMNPASLKCHFDVAEGVNYTASYSIAFVDRQTEGTDVRYRGLFKAQGSEFAVGVEPIEAEDCSTIFEGNKVKLNMNVTNLCDYDLTFSIRYDVMDYYGNIVDSGIFVDSKAYAYVDANRTITVSGKYGMYYLNFYIISKYSTYMETYPFALIEPYEYKYRTTSPFGFSTAIHNDYGFNTNIMMDTANMLLKCGMACLRYTKVDEYSQNLFDKGVQINGHYNPVNEYKEDVESYVDSVMAVTENARPIINAMEVGNEMSLQCMKAGGPTHEEVYPLFYHYTYKPTFKAIKERWPELTYVPTPFSACEPEWIRQFTKGFSYTYTEDNTVTWKHMIGQTLTGTSVWDEIEVACTHIYGHPWMPDAYGTNNPTYGGGLWHIEPGMQRMAQCFSDFRSYRNGKDDPEFYITELGQPSITGSTTGNCLRSHADYIGRMGVIAAAYGADRIEYYCLFDRTSVFSGFKHTDMEWNYGLCYEPDLYGRIMPKPAMIVFANMTRQLESVKKNSVYHSAKVSTEYDEGYANGGVRAYEFDTRLHGKVIAAYSNKQVLPNGKKNITGQTGERIPNLPWNNLWNEYDETEFKAAGDTVTVVDSMGNSTVYKAKDGKVTIPLTGEMVYIHGVK